MNQWISIDDALPAIGGTILVYEQSTGAMYTEEMTNYALAVIGGHEYSAHYMYITHWMPLPTPPELEE